MVTIIKQSGSPINEGDAEQYLKEWREGFDKLFDVDGDMAIVTEKAKAYEEELMDKYDLKHKIKLPKSLKTWKVLLEKYQGAIMVDKDQKTGELMLVILDLGL